MAHHAARGGTHPRLSPGLAPRVAGQAGDMRFLAASREHIRLAPGGFRGSGPSVLGLLWLLGNCDLRAQSSDALDGAVYRWAALSVHALVDQNVYKLLNWNVAILRPADYRLGNGKRNDHDGWLPLACSSAVCGASEAKNVKKLSPLGTKA